LQPGAFTWESFWRQLDSGESKARKILFGSGSNVRVRVLSTKNIAEHIAYLFGFTGFITLLMLILFFKNHFIELQVFKATQLHFSAVSSFIHGLFLLIVIVLNCLAYHANVKMTGMCKSIAKAIEHADGQEEASPRSLRANHSLLL
jgi:hypothetical protein